MTTPAEKKDECRQEYLTSIYITGLWHAVYPTALRTLCLKELPPLATTHRDQAPTCRKCVDTIESFLKAAHEEALMGRSFSTGIPRSWRRWFWRLPRTKLRKAS